METAALAAADKLADGIIAYDVSDQLVITDAFLLCSAPNDRQVKAIVDEIELRMRQAGASLVRREGEREGRWVLLDYLDVVIHVQHSEERTYYSLERIWKDCPQIPLPELVGSAVSGGRPPQTPGVSPGGTHPPGEEEGRPPRPTLTSSGSGTGGQSFQIRSSE